MDVTPLIRKGQQIIQSYASGQFRVSGQIYESAIIVTPEEVKLWPAPDDFKDLEKSHFQALIDDAGAHDVVLLGTGKTMRFIKPQLRQALKQAGLHVEVMGTGAACRTYNVLMAEGRKVAAALMPSSGS